MTNEERERLGRVVHEAQTAYSGLLWTVWENRSEECREGSRVVAEAVARAVLSPVISRLLTAAERETLKGLREWCRQQGWPARVAALDTVLGPAKEVKIWPCPQCVGAGLVGPEGDRKFCPLCSGDGRMRVSLTSNVPGLEGE